jgi:hypothetical protein
VANGVSVVAGVSLITKTSGWPIGVSRGAGVAANNPDPGAGSHVLTEAGDTLTTEAGAHLITEG